jgi:hypothetical protein
MATISHSGQLSRGNVHDHHRQSGAQPQSSFRGGANDVGNTDTSAVITKGWSKSVDPANTVANNQSGLTRLIDLIVIMQFNQINLCKPNFGTNSISW